MSTDPYIGKVFNDRFRVESKIGAGGYGVVYRAVDLETRERVALKLLRPVIANDHRIVARFRREGMVLCRLRNPHTVVVHEFAYTEEGVLYLAMELLKGHSLKRLIRYQAPLDWRRSLDILTQICEALAEAHKAGVIHRDLKPENIFLIDRPENPEFVKILDFGIAKFQDGGGLGLEHLTQLTGHGRTVGTIRYMSPEQILGRELDARSDIYTLGVVLYRMLTGRMPYPGARKPGALIAAQLRGAPKPPSNMRPDIGIPESLDRFVLRMLERDPKDRFVDVDSLRLTCEGMLEDGEWDEEHVQRTVPNVPNWIAPGEDKTDRTEQLPFEDTVDEVAQTEGLMAQSPRFGRPSRRTDTFDETAATGLAAVTEPLAKTSAKTPAKKPR